MSFAPADCDIRAASCTIADRSVFLRQLQGIAAAHDTHIICFNADMIAGRAHAEVAVMLASRAFHEGENISNTVEMEALLYAAGSRQCTIATSFGILKGENRLWVCCIPAREGCWAELSQLFRFTVGVEWDRIDLAKQDRLMEIFAVSQDEADAAGGSVRIVDLVVERVALLQVLR
ncbi:MAG: KEOPS complex subunit Cgi121 [Methanoregula sp.]|jgi:KEOPS complex subunit Cgi121|nr:KEOPS complex subunit Cgi121 [Methanoregula sp.]